jgi:ABC-type lipoprotein export system ATPase subunit
MTAPNDPALQVKVTSFAYCNGAPLALPSFALSAGEIVVLSGRSGSGKSTLLHLVTGVLALDPSQGSIRIVGSELAGLTQTERDRLRPYTIGCRNACI